jgi:hypothetical protein
VTLAIALQATNHHHCRIRDATCRCVACGKRFVVCATQQRPSPSFYASPNTPFSSPTCKCTIDTTPRHIPRHSEYTALLAPDSVSPPMISHERALDGAVDSSTAQWNARPLGMSPIPSISTQLLAATKTIDALRTCC